MSMGSGSGNRSGAAVAWIPELVVVFKGNWSWEAGVAATLVLEPAVGAKVDEVDAEVGLIDVEFETDEPASVACAAGSAFEMVVVGFDSTFAVGSDDAADMEGDEATGCKVVGAMEA